MTNTFQQTEMGNSHRTPFVANMVIKARQQWKEGNVTTPCKLANDKTGETLFRK